MLLKPPNILNKSVELHELTLASILQITIVVERGLSSRTILLG
jgi:hypothetical protein